MLRITVVSMEASLLGGEVGSDGGNYCLRIGIIGGRGEMLSYETVSPPNYRGHCTLLVAVVEANSKVGRKFLREVK